MQIPDKFDQPHPSVGRTSVTDALREHFNKMLDERQKIGIARYGRSLETHNGRNAARDADEEMIDALQYQMQLRLEHDDALKLLELYRTLVGRLFMLDCSQRDSILDETIYDPFLSPQAPVTIRQLVTSYCEQRFQGDSGPGSPSSADVGSTGQQQA